MMRDFFVRAKTGDLHAVHSALADELLAPGRRRDFLFSPVRLPDGGLGAWVRISAPGETRGRLVDIPQAGGEADFIFRAFAAGKGRDGKKRAFPAAPKFDANRRAWLERQGERHGFSVVRASFTLENAAIRRPAGEFGFNVTVFSGRLKVTDAEKFESALREGIGTRRGYGCGMLLLIPDSAAPPESNQPKTKRRTQ